MPPSAIEQASAVNLLLFRMVLARESVIVAQVLPHRPSSVAAVTDPDLCGPVRMTLCSVFLRQKRLHARALAVPRRLSRRHPNPRQRWEATCACLSC